MSPHPIVAATTGVAAFPGAYPTGPTGEPVLVDSWGDFTQRFGALDEAAGLAALGVRQFFQNGGDTACILRTDELTPAVLAAAAGAADLMCLPQAAGQTEVVEAALAACEEHGAFLIVDAAQTAPLPAHPCGAAYYPSVAIPSPAGGGTREVPPSGSVAGVYARMDAARGVWRAPAGLEATLSGVAGLGETIDDRRAAELSAAGINALRTFPGQGPVVWGARTLAGEGEWRYVPVRRLALFIERSIDRSMEWVASEPNGPELWAAIALEVQTFMNALWRQGAFVGDTPAEAYYVACDATTTTAADVEEGRVVCRIGFAALDPAEFVTLSFRLSAGPPPG